MNKTFDLSKKTAIKIRRSVGVSALLLSVAMLVALLCGIIPLYNKASGCVAMVYNAFEVFSILSKSIWYCLSCAGYAVLYYILIIKSIKEIFVAWGARNQWLTSRNDGEAPRKFVTTCVITCNNTLQRFVFLFALSYIINAFKLDFWSWFVIGAIIILTFAVNALRLFFFKRNITDSIISPLSSTLILLTLILFLFNICNVEIAALIRQIANGFSVFGKIGDVTFATLIEVICTSVLLPLFYLYVVYNLVSSFVDSVSYGKIVYGYKEACTKKAIFNIVTICAIVIIQLVVNKNTQPEVIISMLLTHIEFIFMNVAILLLSKNQGCVLPDAPFDVDTPPEEADTAATKPDTAEAVENLNTAENAANPTAATAAENQ